MEEKFYVYELTLLKQDGSTVRKISKGYYCSKDGAESEAKRYLREGEGDLYYIDEIDVEKCSPAKKINIHDHLWSAGTKGIGDRARIFGKISENKKDAEILEGLKDEFNALRKREKDNEKEYKRELKEHEILEVARALKIIARYIENNSAKLIV